LPIIRTFTIRKFTIIIRICENIGEWKDGKKDALFISHSFQISRVLCKGLVVSTHSLIYHIKSRESAKNRPVLDDLLDTCKSYLVQAKVKLFKVVVHIGQKSSASKERYVQLSSEETFETGEVSF